jgi:hypothetical protein
MSQQKAHLLMTVCMTAIDAEPIPFEELTGKMRPAFEQQGGVAVRYTLPAKGNQDSRKVKEHIQAVDSLNKMAARYSSPEDLGYRRSLALLVYLSVFCEGGAVRDGMIDALVLQLNERDPQILAIVDRLRQQA